MRRKPDQCNSGGVLRRVTSRPPSRQRRLFKIRRRALPESGNRRRHRGRFGAADRDATGPDIM